MIQDRSPPKRKRKTPISTEEIRENGQLKQYPEKITSVKTERVVTGFRPEDIQEVRNLVAIKTRELNEAVLALFQERSQEKMTDLSGKMTTNTQSYNERNEVFNTELAQMNARYDELKRQQQRWQDLVSHGMDYKEQKLRRRLCFNILKEFAHKTRDTRRREALHFKNYEKNKLKRCFYFLRE